MCQGVITVSVQKIPLVLSKPLFDRLPSLHCHWRVSVRAASLPLPAMMIIPARHGMRERLSPKRLPALTQIALIKDQAMLHEASISDERVPPFRERPPWLGSDLQTLRNFICGGPPNLSGGERLLLPMQDRDRLAARLDRPCAPVRQIIAPSGATPADYGH